MHVHGVPRGPIYRHVAQYYLSSCNTNIYRRTQTVLRYYIPTPATRAVPALRQRHSASTSPTTTKRPLVHGHKRLKENLKHNRQRKKLRSSQKEREGKIKTTSQEKRKKKKRTNLLLEPINSLSTEQSQIYPSAPVTAGYRNLTRAAGRR